MAAPAPGGDKRKLNGLRMTELVKSIARDVMHLAFIWGTPDKPENVSLFDYLETLTEASSANYKRVHPKQRKFDGTQEGIIAGDTAGRSYDIILLHKVIRLTCRDVAPFDDDKWKAGLNHFESLITKTKHIRNDVIHEELEMSDTEFRDKVIELRDVLSKTLKAAKEKFGKSEDELVEETKKLDDSLFKVCHQILGEEDLLKYSHAKIMNDLITEGIVNLSKILANYTIIEPLHFLPDNRVRVKVEEVFGKIQVMKGDCRDEGTELDYTKLLTLAQCDPGKSRPQLLLNEGDAGSGKSTLLALVAQEWLEGGRGSLIGLDQYQLVLKIQCRDSHIKSFTDLLQNMMPKEYSKYKNLTLPLIKTCRLLVLVDGLDERNDESSKAVADIMDVLKDAPNSTLLITSRPEAITTFKRQIPPEYQVHSLKLIGIAEEERPEFVRRYIQEFQHQTNTNQNIDHLMQTVRKMCSQEHFRLPLNLVFLAWQCLHDPDSVRVGTTQTDLYHWAHTLSKEKLLERLTHLSPFTNMPEDEVKQRVEECLETLYLTMLQALARHQLVLTPQELVKVTTACKDRGVPHQQVLSAFLTMKHTWTPLEVKKQYSCPHKGLQDYLGALHVVTKLMPQQKIMMVLETALGEDNVNLRDLLNMLKHLAGLLHLHMSAVPEQLVQDMVDVLDQAGEMDRDGWLDVLEDTKLSPAILAAIASRFPVDSEIDVKDGRVGTYLALLPHLPPSKVAVSISGDPTPLLSAMAHHTCTKVVLKGDLENYWLTFLANLPQRSPPTKVKVSISSDPTPLLSAMAHHTCTKVVLKGDFENYWLTFLANLPQQSPPTEVKVSISGDPGTLTPLVGQMGRHRFMDVELPNHWYHPHPTTTPNPFLQAVLSRDGLEVFTGQVTVDMTSLPTTIKRLYLALADDNQATTLLPLLHSLPPLQWLNIHVGIQVSPEAITRPLPEVSSGSDVLLFLSDVRVGGEDRIVQLVARLQPPGGYTGLCFPRCQLTHEGWRMVLEGLAVWEVNVWGKVWVPVDPTTEDLDTLTETRLGVELVRRDYSEWQ